jgi:hypothetical protein
LARLTKNAGERLIGKLGAEYVKGGLDVGMDQGFHQRGSKHIGFLALVPQRLRQRTDEISILFRRLHFNADETARYRAAPMRAGRLTLGFAGHAIGSDAL